MDETTRSVISKVECLLQLSDPQSNMTDFLSKEIKCCLVQINSTMSAFDIYYLTTFEDLISNIAYGEIFQDFENLPDIVNIEFFLDHSKSVHYLKRAFTELPEQKENFIKLNELIDKHYTPIELTKLIGEVNGL